MFLSFHFVLFFLSANNLGFVHNGVGGFCLFYLKCQYLEIYQDRARRLVEATGEDPNIVSSLLVPPGGWLLTPT